MYKLPKIFKLKVKDQIYTLYMLVQCFKPLALEEKDMKKKPSLNTV